MTFGNIIFINDDHYDVQIKQTELTNSSPDQKVSFSYSDQNHEFVYPDAMIMN